MSTNGMLTHGMSRLSSVYPQNVYPRNVDPQNFYLRNIYCTYRKSTHIHLPKECLITECLLMNCIHKKCLPVLLDFSGTSPAGTGIVRYIEGKNACGKNRSYTFCTATRVGNSLIGYLSESLVFCPKMSEWVICSKKLVIHSFTHFWWATWAIQSQSLISSERPE